MKNFVFRLTTFLSIFSIFFLINYQINQYFISANIPTLAHVDTLILGDSHTATAIDPVTLGNSVNFSQASEPYIVTLHKLEHLLQRNDVDTVLLGYSYHNFSGFNDQKFVDDRWASAHFERYYPFISLNKLSGLPTDNQVYYQVFLQNLLLFPKRDHISSYTGGFIEREYGLTDVRVRGVINRHYSYNGESAGLSTIATDSLEQIISLAAEREIDLILITTPLHPEYIKLVPEEALENFQSVTESYEDKVTILNYSELILGEIHYSDYTHLTREGAHIFSEQLKIDLTKLQ